MVKVWPFFVLFAVYLFHCFFHFCIGDTFRETVTVFEGNKTDIANQKEKGKPTAFRSPAFVGGVFDTKEFLAIFSVAHYGSDSQPDLIAPAEKISYGNYSEWSDANIFVTHPQKSAAHAIVGNVTTVMKGNKIYAFASSWDETKRALDQHSAADGRSPLMFVGTVSCYSSQKSGGALINWAEGKSLKNLLLKSINGAQDIQFVGGAGNGVVMGNGAIVFPIHIEKGTRQMTAYLLYSTDNGENWKIGAMPSIDASDCSMVEWGKGKLLLMSRCNSNYYEVFESNDMGTTWTESLMFSGVWGHHVRFSGVNSQQSAIKVSVDGKDVLLFLYLLNTKEKHIHETLQLWLSDGQRIVFIGTISEKEKREKIGHLILAHVGDNLYLTREINSFEEAEGNNLLNKRKSIIALSPLPQMFESAKRAVREWRKLDAWLRNKGIPADALVSYLGNTETNGNVWPDMYKCVNATVKGGAQSVPGGFRFDGASGSAVQWPVVNQGQNKIHHFTEKQFTLAASLQIHETTEAEYQSLLGATETEMGSYIFLEIGYKNKKWFMHHGSNSRFTSAHSMDFENEYHVAITFAKGKALVYVDGVEITNGKVKVIGEADIKYFYFGRAAFFSRKGSSCTVKHVMLLNRALSKAEIIQMSNASKSGTLDEPMPTTEPKETTESEKSVPITEQISATEFCPTVSTAEPSEAPKSFPTLQKTEPQQEKATDSQNFTKKNAKETNINRVTQEYRNGAFQKDSKSADGAAVPLRCFVLFYFSMFFVCVAIAIAGV